jgi:hypothetical protein
VGLLESGYTVYSELPAIGYRGKPLIIVWYHFVKFGIRYHTPYSYGLKVPAWKNFQGGGHLHTPGGSWDSEISRILRVNSLINIIYAYCYQYSLHHIM